MKRVYQALNDKLTDEQADAKAESIVRYVNRHFDNLLEDYDARMIFNERFQKRIDGSGRGEKSVAYEVAQGIHKGRSKYYEPKRNNYNREEKMQKAIDRGRATGTKTKEVTESVPSDYSRKLVDMPYRKHLQDEVNDWLKDIA